MNDNLKNKDLVILSTAFGSNYSGGSLATHEIFRRIENRFRKIIAVCREAGNHSFSNLKILKYNGFFGAIKILRSFDPGKTIFYGDFYNSFWFTLAGKPFYFTYHDNWPEQASVSITDRIRSSFYIPAYRSIFRNARAVFTVSQFKNAYVRRFTPHVFLIRNGFQLYPVKPDRNQNGQTRIVMAGNIDRRKYAMAVRLFRKLKNHDSIRIDIFGNIIDRRLAGKLEEYPFVDVQGFKNPVPYPDYDAFLQTSSIENLPISVCEALHNKVPVIAFDVGGIREVVNENCGVLIKPFDLDRMYKAIVKIPENHGNFTFSGNDLEQYNWDTASEAYYKIMTS